MKTVLLAVLFVAGASAAVAQNKNANAVKLNPLSLIFATGNVSYERAINHNQSLQLGVFYSGVKFSGLKYAGYGVTPEYRIYFAGKKEALNGVYVAPFARYQNFSITETEANNKTSFSSYGGGAILGWQKMFNSGFVIDLFAGPSYNSGKFKNDSDEDTYDLSFGMNGVGVRTGITLGFGF